MSDQLTAHSDEAKAGDEFVVAFRRFLDQVDMAQALSVATGLFVGLVVGYAEHAGEDSSKSITINGGDNRDITIHPAK